MRSSVRVLLLLLAGWVDYAAGHAHCLTKAVDLEQTLNFCPTEEDGVCCTEAEDAAVEERFNSVGTLTDDCADFYKQVGSRQFVRGVVDTVDGVLPLPQD